MDKINIMITLKCMFIKILQYFLCIQDRMVQHLTRADLTEEKSVSVFISSF